LSGEKKSMSMNFTPVMPCVPSCARTLPATFASPSRFASCLSMAYATATCWRSGAMWISLTLPTMTPRYLTGDPISRPCTDSSKYEWKMTVSLFVPRMPSPNAAANRATVPISAKSPSLKCVVALDIRQPPEHG
jgi:hypothetical protein